MADIIPPASPIIVNPNNSFFTKRKIVFILISLLILSALIIAGFIILKPNPKIPTPINQSKNDSNIIAKVGEEYIYKQDLEIEVNSQLAKNSLNINELMLNKIIDDSVILQGAQTEKLTTLDSTIFNSPDKDYLKRRKVIDDIRDKIEQNADELEGVIIAVWFLNNKVGPLGYEKSKELAFSKISTIYEQVKNKTISMDQAGKILQNDTSLAQLDPAYKTNSIARFKVTRNEILTLNTEFNNLLWKMPLNTLTEITTLQSQDVDNNSKIVDAYFVFAQINKRTENGIPYSFEGWLKEQKSKYEIKKY